MLQNWFFTEFSASNFKRLFGGDGVVGGVRTGRYRRSKGKSRSPEVANLGGAKNIPWNELLLLLLVWWYIFNANSKLSEARQFFPRLHPHASNEVLNKEQKDRDWVSLQISIQPMPTKRTYLSARIPTSSWLSSPSESKCAQAEIALEVGPSTQFMFVDGISFLMLHRMFGSTFRICRNIPPSNTEYVAPLINKLLLLCVYFGVKRFVCLFNFSSTPFCTSPHNFTLSHVLLFLNRIYTARSVTYLNSV